MTPEEVFRLEQADALEWIPPRHAAAAIRAAVAAEREACLAIMRKYLLFDSQRAVSWHEVQDAIAAIRARKG